MCTLINAALKQTRSQSKEIHRNRYTNTQIKPVLRVYRSPPVCVRNRNTKKKKIIPQGIPASINRSTTKTTDFSLLKKRKKKDQGQSSLSSTLGYRNEQRRVSLNSLSSFVFLLFEVF